jgi:hypothetical protein
MANAIFSDGLKELVLARGKTLSKEELDVGLTTDQKFYERIAEQHNKKGIEVYERIQCAISLAAKYVPSRFSDILWSMAENFGKIEFRNWKSI